MTISTLEVIINGLVVLLFLTFINDHDYVYWYNPTAYIIAGILCVGILMGRLGFKSSKNMNPASAKKFYRWSIIRTVIMGVALPYYQLSCCQKWNEDVLKEEPDGSPYLQDCGNTILQRFPFYLVILAAYIYFAWILLSFIARIQVNQIDLCRFGPIIDSPLAFPQRIRQRSEFTEPRETF